ncbi:rod shape-determining protein MreC [Lysobacter niastensis]|uniref:Cell shape-determining protein MreC n=1 Tax=Lysobacter niastensis TaxID=380629 RepID=A0ABS0B803_9GAMM|nr:rod shape-determining protein MreC [Lysobacter niastensis]MBF6025153.1 rod shape-determining protein MreC [Lysobacter niastensis]
MPSYAGPPTAARTGEVAGTLRLLAYLALAVVLIVLDHRGGWLNRMRQQAALFVQPLWTVAGVPGRIAERISDDAGTLGQLTTENRRLREELLLNQARMARLQTLAADNARLRGLLDASSGRNLDVMLAPVLDIDLDPARQRLVLDAGSRDRVQVGQSVIDSGGLLGQIIGITPMHASVLLITDPSHAVPVAIARNGVRLVAYGEGRSDLLRLSSVPLSSDVKVGDVLVTSGLGGRFPAGFPVGTITRLHPDDSRAFLEGDVKPSAQFDRGREVLVLLSMPTPLDVGKFDSTPPPESTAATVAPGTVTAAGTAANATGNAAPTTAPAKPAAATARPATTAAPGASTSGNAARAPRPSTATVPVQPPVQKPAQPPVQAPVQPAPSPTAPPAAGEERR